MYLDDVSIWPVPKPIVLLMSRWWTVRGGTASTGLRFFLKSVLWIPSIQGPRLCGRRVLKISFNSIKGQPCPYLSAGLLSAIALIVIKFSQTLIRCVVHWATGLASYTPKCLVCHNRPVHDLRPFIDELYNQKSNDSYLPVCFCTYHSECNAHDTLCGKSECDKVCLNIC